MRTTYERIDRDPDSRRLFAADMLSGWDHGEPAGAVIHRQGNPIPDAGSGGASALNAIRWGIRTKAFSIHHYVEGQRVYAGVPEHRHAFHVLEWRLANQRGRNVYRSTLMRSVPRSLTVPTRGQFSGASKPRGDISQIGIECVDRVRTDGTIYFDQDTRITLLLLVRDIVLRRTRARGDWLREFYFPISGHQHWDPWTRAGDPGEALYLPDFEADLLDLLTGREPWRTVTAEYDGSKPAPPRELMQPNAQRARILEHTGVIAEEAESIARLVSL